MLQRAGITSTLTLILSLTLVGPSRSAEPVVQPAVDGIFGAFETHPLVGLGELHNLANELAFYATLVRDPRFADTVGNVVAEFGGSQHQDILDRYLAGEDVPYSEIAQVWRNHVAFSPTLSGVGYQTFYAQVRALNRSLPPDGRIRVLLSEPPIEWSDIHTREAWQQIYDQRSIHAADMIVREILDRGEKALVIYGVGHFFSYPWPSTIPVPSTGTANLAERVERTHPDAFFLITPYSGYSDPDCSATLEAEMNWPNEVLIAPVEDTPLVDVLLRPDCMQSAAIEPPLPEGEQARLEERFYEIEMGVAGDALLYLAPAAELVPTPLDPTWWMDEDYFDEISRRNQIRNGRPSRSLADAMPFIATPPRTLYTR